MRTFNAKNAQIKGLKLVRIKLESMFPWEMLIEAIAVKQRNFPPYWTRLLPVWGAGIILPMAVSQIPTAGSETY